MHVGFVSGAKTFALKAGSFIAGMARTAMAMGTAVFRILFAPGLIVSAGSLSVDLLQVLVH